MKRKFSNSSKIDKIGIICSGACAIHCASIPILTLASPAIASYFENEWIHILLLFIVLPVAGISFFKQYRKTKKRAPMALGLLGSLFVILGLLGHEFGHEIEITLTMIGSMLLISGHLINIKITQLQHC